MKFVDIVDPSIKEVKAKLLELFLKLGEFKLLLCNLKIPVTNVIGMALDGASVIVGKNNSFTSRMILRMLSKLLRVSYFRNNCK